MKPSPFDYIRADTRSEALVVLADSTQDTKVLAGGQSLLPLLNMRLARPSVVLDINHIPDLDGLEMGSSGQDSETLIIGALVRQRTLERYAAQQAGLRLIHTALCNIGHPQTRNRGTVGGSLVHGDASAELPLILVTLGGSVTLQSTRGERTLAAAEFFQSHYTTALEPDELLISSNWPLPAATHGVAFKEYRRRHGDFALMAAACTLALDERQQIQQIRLGLGGVAETPLLVEEALMLQGERWSKERGRAIAEGVARRMHFVDDALASAAYRQQLIKTLLINVVEAAYNDALLQEGMHV
jgi:2-furoyl-CoA dehydrogenase FAD binding subunit